MPKRRVVLSAADQPALPGNLRDSSTEHAASLVLVKETVVLTAVFEPVEGGWIQARVEELPEVITAASTREEAEGYLIDALREYFLSFGAHAPAIDTVPGATRAPLEVTFGT